MLCRICGIDKPETEFGLRGRGPRRKDCKVCRSNSEAARRYGVSIGDVEEMRTRQQNRCAICGTHAGDISHTAFKHNPLVIDHDHATGKLRGLLCPTCNCGLGQFKDDADLLTRAIAYLK